MFKLSASVDTPEYIPQWMKQKTKPASSSSPVKPVNTADLTTSSLPVQVFGSVNVSNTASSSPSSSSPFYHSPSPLPPPQMGNCVQYSEFSNSLLPPPPLPPLPIPPQSHIPLSMHPTPFPVHNYQVAPILPHEVQNNMHLPTTYALLHQPPPPQQQQQQQSMSPTTISITRTTNNSVTTLDRPPFHTQHVNGHAEHALSPNVHLANSKNTSEQLLSSPPLHQTSTTNSARATPNISATHTMSLISKRVPARMSPAVTPSTMNPHALEFVPGKNLFSSSLTEHISVLNQTNASSQLQATSSSIVSSSSALSLLPTSTINHGGLEALPSSTADVEAAVENEQRRKSQESMTHEKTNLSLNHANNINRNITSKEANNHLLPSSSNSNPRISETASHMSQLNNLKQGKNSAETESNERADMQPVKPSPLWRPSHIRSATTSPLIAAATVLLEKSEKEILEISKRSALNASAASYMPKRTMTRLVLTKPSPLTLVPSTDPMEANTEMMLDDLWCLYYLPANMNSKTITKEEEFNPALVFRIESIPTLWKVFNNIPTPSQMHPSTLYLFRDGIDPKWEHSANCNGGIIKVKINFDQIDEAWELLLCRVMGDSWSAAIRDTVNGVVLKVRERVYFLEVWVTKQTPELMKDLAELWQPILGAAFTAVYYTHSSIQERAEAAANALAERQRKQRKRREKLEPHSENIFAPNIRKSQDSLQLSSKKNKEEK